MCVLQYEIAMGEFPYPLKSLRSIFGLIQMVVNGEPPRLHDDRFNDDFKDFITQWYNMICHTPTILDYTTTIQ